ncbi:1-phosphatidylinositol 4,5-bisphosphate phosphodiesterase gamma-1-like [Diabrotica undecimpunctata]|uniref:1-phosphatidylinositol 4,5-bisphosphate phosphodiesterase gamma-1-like n=1 Tax=Diabrotica undecimpunctata TaxID=50387 RepID=UPI003B633F0E
MFNLFNGILSSSGSGYIPEMEQKISQLERGTLVTKYSWRKRPERKTLAIRRETKQLIWTRPASTSKPAIDGAVNLYEVKEIRPGTLSKDFEKWPEESKKLENKCFVVYYGTEFNLRALSISAFSEAECSLWLTGLKYLVEDTIKAPYPLHIQSWLRREFYGMESPRETITLKDLKSFFPKKLPNNKLREIFNEFDTRKKAEIGFDDFTSLYQKMILEESMASELFDKLSEYSSNYKAVNLPDMVSFFVNEQEESLGNDDRAVSQFICDFLKDPQREVQEPFLTIPEFLDFLFSKQNDLWDPKKNTVYQDMSQPLSHYWISSSHNTYLTGDQFSSESSVEAYVRCLRMGCRCIELDCWDGPDGYPFIYHGHTLTTKIKFMDVIKTIKEHAFATSEYPVILSIEDNCTLPQQKKMASAMQEVFGDMLLTQPVESGETKLPSPYALRKKIILKHKKLPEGQDESSFLVRNDATDMDLRNSCKNGIMYLKDCVDKEWNPHFFVLTQSKLFYFDSYKLNQESEKSEDEEDSGSFQGPKNVPNEELHFSEKWFHGRLPKGREEAEQLLRAYSHLGDGTFLVRASVTFVGEYCLSFWRNGQVNHCRIRSKQDKQIKKYYLIEAKYFDSLYSLITHYRTTPLVTADFSITLQEPVPQPNLHENEEWYHKNTGKNQAEEILKRNKTEGAFLVRPSENDTNCYTISFRADKKIKHCRIKLEGRLYTIGNVEFESLVSLINYYQNHPLYRKVKLSEAISEDMVRRMTTEQDDVSSYTTPSYMDPSSINSNVTCIAIYDYRARQNDFLSFCKHAIITNVNKNTDCPGWWKGDYGGLRQKYFPQDCVREIERSETHEIDEASGESALQGSLDMNGVFASYLRNIGQSFEWIVRIIPSTACPPLECGVQTEELAQEWCGAILTVSQMANRIETQHREMERAFKIAKEMSNLIIYCQSTTFNMERVKQQMFIFYEMSSFPENKAEKLICQQMRKFFLKYHQHQFSRVYPKGQRIDSSNYNPINIWNCGSQMVALNFQTGGKPMQLNQAKFRDNGNCGYLLKPTFMLHDYFDPYEKNTLVGVEPLNIAIRVIAGRHLCRLKKGTASPFVEIEVIGAVYDSGIKLVTKNIVDNGLNPKWNEEICEFTVTNPDFALLRFLVQDVDVFGEPNFIGQASYPVTCLRTGYRSVWLKNAYSEDLELSSLLIHISIKTASTI